MSIETVVLRAVEKKFNKKGDSFRMKHEFKMDGSICTESHKDPALCITRETEGWVWHCHRCHESGFIGDRYVNPDSTVNKVKQLKEKEPELPKESYIVKLPADFTPIADYNGQLTDGIPFEAQKWLWQYSITEKDMFDFEFGWSPKYKMVILPLYSSDKRAFKGWIGRRVLDSESKKYHIQKPKGNKDRIYFTVGGGSGAGTKVILVEDCISAIRVNSSLKITTTALLTTSINEALTRKLQGKEVYVWLDADVLAKSVAMVSRLRQFGIEAKHIYTSKDPKCYNSVAIKEIWNESNKETIITKKG
jgi:hypothetical protein